ncbi:MULTISPECIES: DUF6114 domain-containing protein [Streptomyces]|uniref:DUF6114 domain-containing protein n=1 Tax=Streptomyces TaxID=1883 RepID=UPI00081B7D87|nr:MULTISPECIES: DUF6114 domain-containing protein [unclassified Streptomyces]MYQ52518.1 hypothetical protein [Streptomyces sp. SID4941]SCD84220.1 hypothetical protein GA0115247_11459 [Streptomyces sp. PalvLS-984]SDE18741.1 hypothetical protein F558DRAFT_05711 [Streptomyces sp. AmelKG-A3]
MSPESTGQNEHYLTVIRRGFRTWRGDRPFWAGLFTMAGGLPIAYFPYANMHLGNITLAMSTTAGAGSLIIGVLLVTLGLTMWFHSIVRVFAGVAAILLALISIPVANIGGFVIGFVLALLGGALSVSWAPGEPVDEEDTEEERAPASVAVAAAAERAPDDVQTTVAVPQQAVEHGATVPTEGGSRRAG